APPDLGALRRASRLAGLVTLVGAVVVLASIGYSVWRLSDTEARLADEQKQVADLTRDVTALDEKKHGLEARVNDLGRQKEDLERRKGELETQNRALEQQARTIAAAIADAEKTNPKKGPPVNNLVPEAPAKNLP